MIIILIILFIYILYIYIYTGIYIISMLYLLSRWLFIILIILFFQKKKKKKHKEHAISKNVAHVHFTVGYVFEVGDDAVVLYTETDDAGTSFNGFFFFFPFLFSLGVLLSLWVGLHYKGCGKKNVLKLKLGTFFFLETHIL